MASERKIGRDVFRCEKLSAAESLALFARSCSLLGPETLAFLKEGIDRKRASEEYMVLCCAPGADVDKLNALIIESAQLATTKGDPAVVGVQPETMDDTVELAFWVLEVQFRSFLGVALASAASAPKDQAA